MPDIIFNLGHIYLRQFCLKIVDEFSQHLTFCHFLFENEQTISFKLSSDWSNIYSDWLKTDRSQILKPAMNQFLVEIGRPNHDNCQIIYRLYNALLLEWVTEFSEGNGQPITTIQVPIHQATSVAS